MSRIAELLPCPFCGGQADFSETNAWWVRCNECNAETEADMSPEAAAEYWNKRTPAPSTHVDGLQKAIRRHLEWFERFICEEDELNSSTPRKVARNAQDAAADLRAALGTTEGKDNG